MTSDTPAAGRGVPDDPARGRLVAALAAALVGHDAPELRLVRRWLDGWSGLGFVIAGMARRDFDVDLRGFPRGWRATFYPSGLAHSCAAPAGRRPRGARPSVPPGAPWPASPVVGRSAIA